MADVKPTDFVFSSDRIKWKTPEDRAAFEASGTDWADMGYFSNGTCTLFTILLNATSQTVFFTS